MPSGKWHPAGFAESTTKTLLETVRPRAILPAPVIPFPARRQRACRAYSSPLLRAGNVHDERSLLHGADPRRGSSAISMTWIRPRATVPLLSGAWCVLVVAGRVRSCPSVVGFRCALAQLGRIKAWMNKPACCVLWPRVPWFIRRRQWRLTRALRRPRSCSCSCPVSGRVAVPPLLPGEQGAATVARGQARLPPARRGHARLCRVVHEQWHRGELPCLSTCPAGRTPDRGGVGGACSESAHLRAQGRSCHGC
jgi:hypothetical protein